MLVVSASSLILGLFLLWFCMRSSYNFKQRKRLGVTRFGEFVRHVFTKWICLIGASILLGIAITGNEGNFESSMNAALAIFFFFIMLRVLSSRKR